MSDDFSKPHFLGLIETIPEGYRASFSIRTDFASGIDVQSDIQLFSTPEKAKEWLTEQASSRALVPTIKLSSDS